MTRPQIITLELEDCSDALVEYVERLEQALAYESDWAEQALQSRKELADQLEKLQSKYDHVLQEAKIHSCELDTQKSIVLELCKLLGLRVYDYHCVSKAKEAIIELKRGVAHKAYTAALMTYTDEPHSWCIDQTNLYLNRTVGKQ